MTEDATLSPDTPQPIILGFRAVGVRITNNSNCWLTLGGQYIADPNEKSPFVFDTPTSTPQLALTSTAPPSQTSPSVGQGTCYLQFTDDPGDPILQGQGFVAANLPIAQNLTLLGTLQVTSTTPGGITQVLNVPVPITTQTLIAVAHGGFNTIGGTVFVRGNTSQIAYFPNTNISIGTPIYSIFIPVTDKLVTLEVDATPTAGHSCTVDFIGSPYPLAILAPGSPTGQPARFALQVHDTTNGFVNEGAAYQYPTSKDGVAAEDRPLDTWEINATDISDGSAVTQAGIANQQIVVTQAVWTLTNGIGAAGVASCYMTDTSGNKARAGRVAIAGQNAGGTFQLQPMRHTLPIGDNFNMYTDSLPAQWGNVMHAEGYYVVAPNS